jgi:hypothetical protein
MNVNAILAAHEQLALRLEKLQCHFLTKEDRETNRAIAEKIMKLSTKCGRFFRETWPLFLSLQRNAAADKRDSDKVNGVLATLLFVTPGQRQHPLDTMKFTALEIVTDFENLSDEISAFKRKLADNVYNEASHRREIVAGAGLAVFGALMFVIPTPVTMFMGVYGIISGTAAVSGMAVGAPLTLYGAVRTERGRALEKFRTNFRVLKADISAVQAFFASFYEAIDNELRDQHIRVGENRGPIDLNQIDALTGEFVKLWEAFLQFPQSFGAAVTAMEQPVANDVAAAGEEDALVVRREEEVTVV